MWCIHHALLSLEFVHCGLFTHSLVPECDSVTSLQVRFGCDHLGAEAEAAAEIQSSPVALHAGSSLTRASLEGNGSGRYARFLNL